MSNIFSQLAEFSLSRFLKRKDVIEPLSDKVKSRTPLDQINSEIEINKRKEHIEQYADLPDITKERVLGRNDFLDIFYLEKGMAVARTVGRIIIKNYTGTAIGFGTGFLISPTTIITNAHVLPDADIAKSCVIEFDYEYQLDGRLKPTKTFELDPDSFFVTSPETELDYTIVAVKERDIDQRYFISEIPCIYLIEDTGKIAIGECLSIIQHPNGEVKQIAIRENKLIDKDERYLRYVTDTAPGSSGSMVLNDQWEVVALHHAGVPRRNENDQIMAINGLPWDGKKDTDIDWIANEGIRISRIIADLKLYLTKNDKEDEIKSEILCYALV